MNIETWWDLMLRGLGIIWFTAKQTVSPLRAQ